MPVEWHGQVVPAHSKIALLTGSAGRDEREYAEPDRFDVARTFDRHVTFGYGVHFCLGASLARLEAAVVIEETLDRFPEWHVDEREVELVRHFDRPRAVPRTDPLLSDARVRSSRATTGAAEATPRSRVRPFRRDELKTRSIQTGLEGCQIVGTSAAESTTGSAGRHVGRDGWRLNLDLNLNDFSLNLYCSLSFDRHFGVDLGLGFGCDHHLSLDDDLGFGLRHHFGFGNNLGLGHHFGLYHHFRVDHHLGLHHLGLGLGHQLAIDRRRSRVPRSGGLRRSPAPALRRFVASGRRERRADRSITESTDEVDATASTAGAGRATDAVDVTSRMAAAGRSTTTGGAGGCGPAPSTTPASKHVGGSAAMRRATFAARRRSRKRPAVLAWMRA